MMTHPSHRFKVIAGLMAAVFLCQEIAWAAPGGVPAAGAASIPMVPPPLGINGLIANPGQIDIPFDAVTLQEIHPGTNGKLIIHIQDAHANLSGQQSLAKAVEHFLVKYGVKTVLVEGADRDVTLDPIRKLAPLSEWKIIARRFLYEGIISGEEYLNLTSEQPMKLRGIEYQDLYNDAVRAYASLVDRRKDILHYLYQSKVSLDRLKARMYPPTLLDYEKKKSGVDPDLGGDFKEQAEGLFALCETAGMGLEDYPQMQRMKELFEKEKSIDFERANREQASILSRVSPEIAKGFAEASRRLRSSQVSQYRMIQQLLGEARAQGLDPAAFPALAEYSKYLERFLDLKIEALMAEEELLEDRVFEKLLPDDDARKVRAIDRFLGLLGNAYKLQMSSRDFKMFEFNEKDFPTESWLAFMNRKLADLGFFESMVPTKPYLEEARADFGKFYKLVGQRDEAFVENANKIMAEEGTDAAVLIAGGYHTDHLTELLRAEGTSYIVLTPLVTDKTDQEKYEEILLSQLKSQEKHIAAHASDSSDQPDTGTNRAQNVAVTRIPRGVRSFPVAARISGGIMPQKTLGFVGARLGTDFIQELSRGAKGIMTGSPNHQAASGGSTAQKASALAARMSFSEEDKNTVHAIMGYGGGPIDLYGPGVLIDALKKDDEIKRAMETILPDGKTLEGHTLDVMKQFLESDHENYLPEVPGLKILPLIRLALALHDIGKPGHPEDQHTETVRIIRRVGGALELSEQEVRFIIALVGDDPIGRLIAPGRADLTVDQAYEVVSAAAKEAGVDAEAFLEILRRYFVSDATAYPEFLDSFVSIGNDWKIINPLFDQLAHKIMEGNLSVEPVRIEGIEPYAGHGYGLGWHQKHLRLLNEEEYKEWVLANGSGAVAVSMIGNKHLEAVIGDGSIRSGMALAEQHGGGSTSREGMNGLSAATHFTVGLDDLGKVVGETQVAFVTPKEALLENRSWNTNGAGAHSLRDWAVSGLSPWDADDATHAHRINDLGVLFIHVSLKDRAEEALSRIRAAGLPIPRTHFYAETTVAAAITAWSEGRLGVVRGPIRVSGRPVSVGPLLGDDLVGPGSVVRSPGSLSIAERTRAINEEPAPELIQRSLNVIGLLAARSNSRVAPGPIIDRALVLMRRALGKSTGLPNKEVLRIRWHLAQLQVGKVMRHDRGTAEVRLSTFEEIVQLYGQVAAAIRSSEITNDDLKEWVRESGADGPRIGYKIGMKRAGDDKYRSSVTADNVSENLLLIMDVLNSIQGQLSKINGADLAGNQQGPNASKNYSEQFEEVRLYLKVGGRIKEQNAAPVASGLSGNWAYWTLIDQHFFEDLLMARAHSVLSQYARQEVTGMRDRFKSWIDPDSDEAWANAASVESEELAIKALERLAALEKRLAKYQQPHFMSADQPLVAEELRTLERDIRSGLDRQDVVRQWANDRKNQIYALYGAYEDPPNTLADKANHLLVVEDSRLAKTIQNPSPSAQPSLNALHAALEDLNGRIEGHNARLLTRLFRKKIPVVVWPTYLTQTSSAARMSEALDVSDDLYAGVKGVLEEIAKSRGRPFKNDGSLTDRAVLSHAKKLMRSTRPVSFKEGGENVTVGRHIESYYGMIDRLLSERLITLKTALVCVFFAERHDIGYDVEQVLQLLESVKEGVRSKNWMNARAGFKAIGLALGLDEMTARRAAGQMVKMIKIANRDGNGAERQLFIKVLMHGVTSAIINYNYLVEHDADPEFAMGFSLLMATHHTGFPINFVWDIIAPLQKNQKGFKKILRIMQPGIFEEEDRKKKRDPEYEKNLKKAKKEAKILAEVMLTGTPYLKEKYKKAEIKRLRQVAAASKFLNAKNRSSDPTNPHAQFAALAFLLDRMAPSNGEWLKRYGVILTNLNAPRKMTLRHLLALNITKLKEELRAGVYSVQRSKLRDLKYMALINPFLKMTDETSREVLTILRKNMPDSKKAGLRPLKLDPKHEKLTRKQIKDGDVPLIYLLEILKPKGIDKVRIASKRSISPEANQALKDLSAALQVPNAQKHIRRHLPRSMSPTHGSASAARMSNPDAAGARLAEKGGVGQHELLRGSSLLGALVVEIYGEVEKWFVMVKSPGEIPQQFHFRSFQDLAAIFMGVSDASGQLGVPGSSQIQPTYVLPEGAEVYRPDQTIVTAGSLGALMENNGDVVPGMGMMDVASFNTILRQFKQMRDKNVPIRFMLKGTVAEGVRAMEPEPKRVFLEFLKTLQVEDNTFVWDEHGPLLDIGGQAPANALRATIAGVGEDALLTPGEGAALNQGAVLNPFALIFMALIVQAKGSAGIMRVMDGRGNSVLSNRSDPRLGQAMNKFQKDLAILLNQNPFRGLNTTDDLVRVLFLMRAATAAAA